MEKLIKTLTDGITWLMMVSSMLATAALVIAGAYSLIEGPELSDLLLLIGAGFTLAINLMISNKK